MRTLWLSLVLGGVVVFSGCVSTQTYEKDLGALQQQLSASQEESKKLQEQNDALNASRETLENENRQINVARSDIEISQRSLETDNAQLAGEKNRLAGEVGQLQRELSTRDRLIASLRQEVSEGKVRIAELEGQLSVTFVESLLFASGSAEITKEGKAVLDRVAEVINQRTDKNVSVEGHADAKLITERLKGRYATNWELSADRASRVARYLTEKKGVNPDRVSATGFSRYHPIASNDTKEGRAKNRRVEILLISPNKTVRSLQ